MKRFIPLLLLTLILPFLFCGCAQKKETEDGKIEIVATLFPQYDFARQIGGEKVSVSLLLPPGTESHHFDPTPSDIVTINNSDLFIYTGDMMEGWAGDIAASLSGDTVILNVSENIDLAPSHDHSHDHALDPHIWLDFDKAKAMCENITDSLIALSPTDEEYFRKNCEEYCRELTSLDESYREVLSQETTKDLVFGGRFALGYLVERYSIPHQSAYESCSANDEPSPKVIAELSQYVKDNDVHVVYCEEFSDPKVAKEIASANNAEVLVLHSAHNTSREERDNNVTFISIMEQNLENIRKGLN